MSTPGSWTSRDMADRAYREIHTEEHNRLYYDGVYNMPYIDFSLHQSRWDDINDVGAGSAAGYNHAIWFNSNGSYIGLNYSLAQETEMTIVASGGGSPLATFGVWVNGDFLQSTQLTTTGLAEYTFVLPQGTEVFRIQKISGGSLVVAEVRLRPENYEDISKGSLFVDKIDGHTFWVVDSTASSAKFINQNGLFLDTSNDDRYQPGSVFIVPRGTGFNDFDPHPNGTYVGNDLSVEPNNWQVVLGKRAESYNAGDTIIGSRAASFGDDHGYSVSIGYMAETMGEGTIGIGSWTWTTGEGTISVGYEASASGNGAISLGASSSASAVGGIAIGDSSSAGHTSSIALGKDTSTTHQNQVAIGDRDLEIQAADPSTDLRGVVMQSSDGTRWHMTVNDEGYPVFTSVDAATPQVNTIGAGGGDAEAVAYRFQKYGPVPNIPVFDAKLTLDLGFAPWAPSVIGDTYYLLDNQTIKLFDTTEITQEPIEMGSYELTSYEDYLTNMATDRHYVYVLDEVGEFYILNVADPTDIQLVSGPHAVDPGGDDPFDGMCDAIEASYPLLFISGGGNNGNVVSVFNVSDPVTPVELDKFYISDETWTAPYMYHHSVWNSNGVIRAIFGSAGDVDPSEWKVVESHYPYDSVQETQSFTTKRAGSIPTGSAWIDENTVVIAEWTGTGTGSEADLRVYNFDEGELKSLVLTNTTSAQQRPERFLLDGDFLYMKYASPLGIRVYDIGGSAINLVTAYVPSGGSTTQAFWPVLKDNKLIAAQGSASGGYWVFGGLERQSATP